MKLFSSLVYDHYSVRADVSPVALICSQSILYFIAPCIWEMASMLYEHSLSTCIYSKRNNAKAVVTNDDCWIFKC